MGPPTSCSGLRRHVRSVGGPRRRSLNCVCSEEPARLLGLLLLRAGLASKDGVQGRVGEHCGALGRQTVYSDKKVFSGVLLVMRYGSSLLECETWVGNSWAEWASY